MFQSIFPKVRHILLILGETGHDSIIKSRITFSASLLVSWQPDSISNDIAQTPSTYCTCPKTVMYLKLYTKTSLYFFNTKAPGTQQKKVLGATRVICIFVLKNGTHKWICGGMNEILLHSEWCCPNREHNQANRSESLLSLVFLPSMNE
jgi:hypothetical protein